MKTYDDLLMEEINNPSNFKVPEGSRVKFHINTGKPGKYIMVPDYEVLDEDDGEID